MVTGNQVVSAEPEQEQYMGGQLPSGHCSLQYVSSVDGTIWLA